MTKALPGRSVPGWSRALALAASALLLTACALGRPTAERLPSLWYPAVAGERAATLMVMLPGARDAVEAFERSGLVSRVHQVFPDWDLVAVDAHLGYYRNRSFLERLRIDVIEPARARGYQRIWLTGPSLGGFGSLLYLCLGDSDDVVGAIAIAPYLGGRAILADIEAAGGADRWQPSGAGEDFEREIWQCLQSRAAESVWLAWGEEDRIGRGNRLLAELMPPERVTTAPGGHRWTVWVELWTELLARIEEPEH